MELQTLAQPNLPLHKQRLRKKKNKKRIHITSRANVLEDLLSRYPFLEHQLTDGQFAPGRNSQRARTRDAAEVPLVMAQGAPPRRPPSPSSFTMTSLELPPRMNAHSYGPFFFYDDERGY